MVIEEAQKIIEATNTNFDLKNRILEGLNLLSKYVDNLNHKVAAEHDILYACDFNDTVEKMTEEEVTRMTELGWFKSEDSWAFFT